VADYVKDLGTFSPQTEKYNLWGPPLNKKYRSHFEIIALVLEAIKTEWSTSFLIMKRAGINCRQLKKYLGSLTEIGFVDIDTYGDRGRYRASEQGLEFLRQYYVLLGTLLNTKPKTRPASPIDKNIVQPVLQRDT
jgi:predicted transcriptional regulator